MVTGTFFITYFNASPASLSAMSLYLLPEWPLTFTKVIFSVLTASR